MPPKIRRLVGLMQNRWKDQPDTTGSPIGRSLNNSIEKLKSQFLGSPEQDDELVILPRVSEFIKLTMLSILLNPVNACLSMCLPARPCASISSGSKGCIGSGNMSFERRRQVEDIFAIRLVSSPLPPKEKPYQAQKRKHLNIFDYNSTIPLRPVPFHWVSPKQHFSKLQATPAMVVVFKI
ncbi:hypothetical protein TNCV_3806921 [Trichonephila clavipes]|nr:hypothetical protein TNCV_3806921 [Trichonephila clavipes]